MSVGKKFTKNRDIETVKEKDLQSRFVSLLKELDILYIKTNGGAVWFPQANGEYKMAHQKKSFPDLELFTSNGNTIWNEFKTEIGTLREGQIDRIARLMEQGFNCYVFRPKHWNKFVDRIRYEINEKGINAIGYMINDILDYAVNDNEYIPSWIKKKKGLE